MTVTYFQELAKSRDAVIDLRAGSTTHNYLALVSAPYDVSDDQDVIAYAQANLTARYGYQLLRNLTTRSLGGPAWEVAATYGFDEGDSVALPPGDALSYEFTFDTTGGTLHITQSLETRAGVKFGVPAATREVNDLVTVGPRTVTDAATTVDDATLTSATAAFTSADVGAVVRVATAGVLPVVCTIASVTNGTTVELSSKARLTLTALSLTIDSVIIQSATVAFVAADEGAAVSSGTAGGVLPDPCTIRRVISATQAQIAGGTITSTQAAANLKIEGLAATDYKRAIGVSRDGVAGTDKVAPKLEFQIVRNFVGMTLDYIRACKDLTGTINDAPFYGFEAGECLFLGASGTPSQNNQAAAAPLTRVTFRFAASANRTDIDLVPDDEDGNHLLRIAEKKGWDYLWVGYATTVDTRGVQAQRPQAAYVEVVYEDGDFSQLLIGTG